MFKNTNMDRLYVALVTPYKDGSYEIDEQALRNLLRYFMQDKFVEAGGGMIINPEAGELFYLTREEKLRNVQIAVEECKGKVPIFAGALALTTEETVQVAVDAKNAGVDGIFVIPPMGSMDITTSWNSDKYPEVWIDLVKAIAAEVNLPMITHPVGAPSAAYGIGISRDVTLQMIAEIPNIVGWKMTYSYEGFKTIAKTLRNLEQESSRHVGILGATANLFHEVLLNEKFDGTVTGSFNYAMEPMIDHIAAWKRGDLALAKKIWNLGLSDLHAYIYSEWSRLHVRYKIATWLRGLVPHPFMRPPMPKPKKEEILAIKDLLRVTGVSIITEQQVEKVLSEL
ncbi:dihydrodipicolinate synthase family protein [Paradesulfitobacterium ferrireducens]|uniref:dihydrodipicolinate synthase family protein n=1 Tax=Paradesulfitobacterium ferrireducens TaxID=2816476 RepID=UPI001A8DE15A|nr:dihydrodipicolinate synthase family protein [Paradesulfitobacterium ferrireducens]